MWAAHQIGGVPGTEAITVTWALTGLRAVHANVRKLGYSYAQTDPPEPSVTEYDAAEGPLHPVVRRLPETSLRRARAGRRG